MERDEILGRLRERIVAFATSRYSREVAEDLAQEVLLVLHEKYPTVDRLDELLPLSLQIVRFKISTFRRKAIRHGEFGQVSVEDIPLPDPGEGPAAYAERRERLNHLKAAISGLGERCREMIRLKLEGKSFEEIRVLMGAGSINTVYTWDHRCRKQLQELLGEGWEEEQ